MLWVAVGHSPLPPTCLRRQRKAVNHANRATLAASLLLAGEQLRCVRAAGFSGGHAGREGLCSQGAGGGGGGGWGGAGCFWGGPAGGGGLCWRGGGAPPPPPPPGAHCVPQQLALARWLPHGRSLHPCPYCRHVLLLLPLLGNARLRLPPFIRSSSLMS